MDPVRFWRSAAFLAAGERARRRAIGKIGDGTSKIYNVLGIERRAAREEASCKPTGTRRAIRHSHARKSRNIITLMGDDHVRKSKGSAI